MGLVTLFLAWLTGGFTVLPVLLVLAIYLSPRIDIDARLSRSDVLPKPGKDEIEKAELRADETSFSGALIARRTYEPSKDTSSEGTYVGMVASGYRSFVDARSKDPKLRQRAKLHRDAVHAVLKGSTLFIYDVEPILPPTKDASHARSDLQTRPSDCVAVLDLKAHDVGLHPIDRSTIDGELFMKRTAIELKPKAAGEEPWYLFAKTNSEKEDLYFMLIHASKSAADRANDRTLFDAADMAALVAGIDASPDPIPTRWLNALVGRIFLSVYRTDAIEAYIIDRIVRKLGRVSKPSYLSDIQVREVSVGRSVPQISRPMLKALTEDGVAEAEVHVAYAGFFRITIETTATINLGARFKPYTVRLVLAIILREIEGQFLVRLKPPPSDRIWFAFTSPPRVVLDVEPVVSTRQIKWSMITKPIESRIRELITESIVAPNFDDIAFFDTRSYLRRGGIFADAGRKRSEIVQPIVEPTGPEDELLSMDEAEATGAVNGIDTTLRNRKGKKGEDDAASMLSANSSAFSLGRKVDSEATPRKKSWFSATSSPPSNSSSSSALSVPLSPSRQGSADNTSTHDSLGSSPSEDSAAAKLQAVLQSDRSRSASIGKNRTPPREPSPARTPEIDEEEPQTPRATISEPLAIASSGAAANAEDKSAEVASAGEVLRSSSPTASLQIPPSRSARADETSDTESIATVPSSRSSPMPSNQSSPMPPPKRTHQASASVDSTTSARFSAWRAKATQTAAESPTVQAGLATMQRWRTNWKTQADERRALREKEAATATPDFEFDFAADGEPHSRRPSSIRVASGSGIISPSPAQATTSVSPPPALPARAQPATYKAAPSMAIPGFHNPSNRGGYGSETLATSPPATASQSPLMIAAERTASPSPARDGLQPTFSPPLEASKPSPTLSPSSFGRSTRSDSNTSIEPLDIKKAASEPDEQVNGPTEASALGVSPESDAHANARRLSRENTTV